MNTPNIAIEIQGTIGYNLFIIVLDQCRTNFVTHL